MAVFFTPVPGSPFTLSTAWKKVASVGEFMVGLRLSPHPGNSNDDIEWVSYPAGTYATDNLVPDAAGEPIFAGDDFAGGVPRGDIYCRSPSGMALFVKTAG